MPRRGIAGAVCTIWAAFSSSVIRDTRSLTRSSRGKRGLRNGARARPDEEARGVDELAEDVEGAVCARAMPVRKRKATICFTNDLLAPGSVAVSHPIRLCPQRVGSRLSDYVQFRF